MEQAAVGQPIKRLGIWFFPVYLPGNNLPEIATGRGAGLAIDELPAASVPFLRVTNPTDKPILLPEGEQLIGGNQDRVLNTSVLVPPATDLEIPVSCIERGRWGGRGRFARPPFSAPAPPVRESGPPPPRRVFEHGQTYSPRRTRRAKSQSVSSSVVGGGVHRSDQGAVWRSIDEELALRGVRSQTGAARDADQALERDRKRAESIGDLIRRGPLPGQCGVVAAHGRRITATDIFGVPELLAPHWEGLIRSYLAERPTAEGRPSATGALSMINSLVRKPTAETQGVGLGVELHRQSPRSVSQALLLDGAVVHAFGFRLD